VEQVTGTDGQGNTVRVDDGKREGKLESNYVW
jgi:hypothetical protein